MCSHRDELIATDTGAKLCYALVKTSNARNDRFFQVSLVKGGLNLAGGGNGESLNYSQFNVYFPLDKIRKKL